LYSIDLGFQKESVLEIALYPKPGGYQNLNLNSYHKQLVARISSLPGVSSVSFGDATIPNPQGWHDTVSQMTADSSTGIRLMANAALVSPGFSEHSEFRCFGAATSMKPMMRSMRVSPS